MSEGYEPGLPHPRDRTILDVLQQRDGQLSEVELGDGTVCAVWNIAWGYDAGDSWAHVTTNISPDVPGQAIDVFSTHEVRCIRAPGSDEVIVGQEAS